MAVIALGLNHVTAPLELRSKFALPAHELGPTLQAFQAQSSSSPEVTIVSTCNRTELYLGQASDPGSLGLISPAIDWLAKTAGVSAHTVREHSYVFEGPAAARHAFRVASGLDSMVLGEPLDKVMEGLAKGLTQKMLHGSLTELHASQGQHRHQLAQTLSRLFLRNADQLPPDVAPPNRRR